MHAIKQLKNYNYKRVGATENVATLINKHARSINTYNIDTTFISRN